MPLIQLAIKIRGPNINSLLIWTLCKEAGNCDLMYNGGFHRPGGHVPNAIVLSIVFTKIVLYLLTFGK